MKHYLVIGRMCGDDEDTGITYQVETRAEAVSLYVEDMWEMELTSVTDPDDPDTAGRRANAEDAGEGVFINAIYESDTPIKEAA